MNNNSRLSIIVGKIVNPSVWGGLQKLFHNIYHCIIFLLPHSYPSYKYQTIHIIVRCCLYQLFKSRCISTDPGCRVANCCGKPWPDIAWGGSGAACGAAWGACGAACGAAWGAWQGRLSQGLPLHVYIHTYIVSIYTDECVYIRMYVCMYIYIYIYVHVCIYIYVYIL